MSFSKITIEQYHDNYGLILQKTRFEYTPESLKVTEYYGKNLMGNLIQDHCTKVYEPADISSMDAGDIQTLLSTPNLVFHGQERSSDCDSSIFSFGYMVPGAEQTQVEQFERNYIFTPQEGEETKVYLEINNTLPSS